MFLFIDLKETRRLWTEALKRSDKLSEYHTKLTWERILLQAQQHPVQIRDLYKIIIYKDDPYYLKKWMRLAGSKNLDIQMPKIIENKLLSNDMKINLSSYWKKLSLDKSN